MWHDLPWKVTSTGSMTRLPSLQEKTTKRISLPQQNPVSFLAKWDPIGSRSIIIIIIWPQLEARMEPTSHPDVRGVPQWSIFSLSRARSIHSLPAQRPIIIQNGLISWTRLNLAGYINRPGPASARIPQPDLVETTFLGQLSPSLAHSDLIETTSLGRPVGLWTRIGIWLTPWEKVALSLWERDQTPLRPLHALHCLTSR